MMQLPRRPLNNPLRLARSCVLIAIVVTSGFAAGDKNTKSLSRADKALKS